MHIQAARKAMQWQNAAALAKYPASTGAGKMIVLKAHRAEPGIGPGEPGMPLPERPAA
jgi:hypothetical protein